MDQAYGPEHTVLPLLKQNLPIYDAQIE
jgi:hypothetical protein